MAEFEINLTVGAGADLKWSDAYARTMILNGLELHLRHEPTTGTQRLKSLRPNAVAGWELRLGDFRVLYDVDAMRHSVTIQVIGLKRGNRLIVQGKEFKAHESDQA